MQLEERSGTIHGSSQQEAFPNIDGKVSLFKTFKKFVRLIFRLVQSPEFANGVDKLCEVLKIPSHPDPIVRLEACHKLLKSRIGMKSSEENSVEVNLQEHDFGFTEKSMDPVLREAAKILRMLHLTQLRKLQSDINNTIEMVQGVTANPKTDTKLGKVGR